LTIPGARIGVSTKLDLTVALQGILLGMIPNSAQGKLIEI
jgi:hypothetical protein